MRNKFKVLICIPMALLLFVWGCDEDTIELTPIGDTEAAFFQNEAQMQAAVFGTYQKLNFFYIWNAQNFLARVALLPSDDITTNRNDPYENFTDLTGDDRFVRDVFRNSYQLIARANTVLEKIEENGDLAYGNNTALRNANRGEMLFLRAYTHMKLWTVFGTAPVVTERITELENAYLPNSTGTQLLDQAITDLQEAATLLPASWDDGNLGRVTQSSANGLLTKALVIRGTVTGDASDFSAAVTAFNATSGQLAPNFYDNFDINQENNVESLFEFQASRQSARVNGWVAGAGANDAFAVIGEVNSFYGFFNNNRSQGATYTATPLLLESFDPGDPRLSLAFDLNNTGNPERNILKYITGDPLMDNSLANPGNTMSENNARILRYADVLLLGAEAIVRSGGSISEAIGLVNQVRERARNSVDPPASEPADFAVPATADEALELVLAERRRELAAEEDHRWVDLKRRHLGGEIDLTTFDFGSFNENFSFNENNLNFPFPNSEVIINPNLTQNPGY